MYITDMKFSLTTEVFAVGCADGRVYLHNSKTYEFMSKIETSGNCVVSKIDFSADGDVLRAEYFGKIDVGACGGKGNVIAQYRAVFQDIDFFKVIDKDHHVRHTRVDEMNSAREAFDGEIEVQS